MTAADSASLDGARRPAILMAGSMDEPAVAADPSRKRVLVVDDDQGQLDLFSFLAAKEGFRVDSASSGAAAWAKLQSDAPDLIILDLMLPGLGGYEILRQLQAEGLGSIPVVVVSAKAMDAKAIALLKQEPNVRDFVAKPASAAAFAAKLHGLLGTRPRGDEPAA